MVSDVTQPFCQLSSLPESIEIEIPNNEPWYIFTDEEIEKMDLDEAKQKIQALGIYYPRISEEYSRHSLNGNLDTIENLKRFVYNMRNLPEVDTNYQQYLHGKRAKDGQPDEVKTEVTCLSNLTVLVKGFVIPRQLEGCRFIRLGKRSKAPQNNQKNHFESDNFNYKIDDSVLLMHLERGGNYGVLLRNIVCIDCDTHQLWQNVPDAWKESFVVHTGRESGDGRHIYLFCRDAPQNLKINFGSGNDAIGDIRFSGHGSYLVGPGCIHPQTGKPYTWNDKPVLHVEWNELKEFIEKCGGETEKVKEQPQTQRARPSSNFFGSISDELGLRITDILMPINHKPRGNQIEGTHPIHGSETGNNLIIDPIKNTWYCWRCNSGGGPIEALMVASRIIDCSNAGKGCADGHWADIYKELEKRGYKHNNRYKADLETFCVDEPEEKKPDHAKYTAKPLIDSAIEKLIACAEDGQRGLARLYIHLYRDRFIFDHTGDQWYEFYDHCWHPDTLEQHTAMVTRLQIDYLLPAMLELEKELVNLINKNGALSEAMQEKQKTQFEKDEKTLKYSISLLRGSIKRLDNLAYRRKVTEFAAIGTEGLSTETDRFDADPYLLCCKNGVLNLHDITLRDGNPADLIRRQIPTPYISDAKCESFEKFLRQVLDEETTPAQTTIPSMVEQTEEQKNESMSLFMQRIFGLGLVGDSDLKQYLLILTGRGRNGKGTFLDTISEVLGHEIMPKITSSTLIVNNHGKSAGAATPEVLSLHGSRIAYASETNDSSRFDLSKVKELSGGGFLRGREPYAKREIQFKSSHLLVLDTNSKPSVNPDDYAFFARMKCVEFRLSFVDQPDPKVEYERKRDPHLKEKLKQEAPGILRWLVLGWQTTRDNGFQLDEPQAVVDATKLYRADNDLLAEFVSENCISDVNSDIKASKLYSRYAEWCERCKLKPMSAQKFGRSMGLRYKKEARNDGTYYVGIILR